MANVDRQDYIKKMDNLKSWKEIYHCKFEWLNMKNTLLNFYVKQEKYVEKVFKKFVESNKMTKKDR